MKTLDDIAQLDWGEGPFVDSAALATARAAVIARPRDEEALRVFSDLAIEEGHPHGELVRLALLKRSLEGVAKRGVIESEDELLGRYARAIFPHWFDPAFARHTWGSGSLPKECTDRLTNSFLE